MKQKYKITIAGCGYVGMSLAVLLAQKNNVNIYDIDEDRVNKVNSNRSTVEDEDIDNFLLTKELNLFSSSNLSEVIKDTDFLIIATPTNYNPANASFDTSSVKKVIQDAKKINRDIFIVIKSTVPVGFTDMMQEKYEDKKIIFSPEFLREGKALYDNLYPSRIIVGGDSQECRSFSEILESCSYKQNIEKFFMTSKEAEAVKLFSNSYLAMRVAFFNELDSFALHNNINPKNIIEGVSSDTRIGNGYNNPSFGYGGYCLPKDTKQLLANYSDIPQELISSIILSNETRKNFISQKIINLKPKVIGFYDLAMKKGSDNHRDSAIISIIEQIKKKSIKSFIYDQAIEESHFLGLEVISDLTKFKNISDLIIANRISNDLSDCMNKVFSRDIFGVD